jgi:hypothetical protein
MKLHHIIAETPLPDDWDKEVYKNTTSFAKRLRYAQERAQKVGTGSSRVAFIIEYEGRKTVLKIAKNKKGIAQNDFESQMFEDYYFTGMGISIPMIDYDEENEIPTWIHTEFAQKIKPTQFKQFFGGYDARTIVRLASGYSGKFQNVSLSEEEMEVAEHLSEENDYFNSLLQIIGNYNIPPGDFEQLANWGIYKNQPVIIDIGHSSDVMTKYYT